MCDSVAQATWRLNPPLVKCVLGQTPAICSPAQDAHRHYNWWLSDPKCQSLTSDVVVTHLEELKRTYVFNHLSPFSAVPLSHIMFGLFTWKVIELQLQPEAGFFVCFYSRGLSSFCRQIMIQCFVLHSEQGQTHSCHVFWWSSWSLLRRSAHRHSHQFTALIIMFEAFLHLSRKLFHLTLCVNNWGFNTNVALKLYSTSFCIWHAETCHLPFIPARGQTRKLLALDEVHHKRPTVRQKRRHISVWGCWSGKDAFPPCSSARLICPSPTVSLGR